MLEEGLDHGPRGSSFLLTSRPSPVSYRAPSQRTAGQCAVAIFGLLTERAAQPKSIIAVVYGSLERIAKSLRARTLRDSPDPKTTTHDNNSYLNRRTAVH